MGTYYLVVINMKSIQGEIQTTSSIGEEIIGRHSSNAPLNILFPDFCPSTNKKPTIVRPRSASFNLSWGTRRGSHYHWSVYLCIPCSCNDSQLDDALDIQMSNSDDICFLTPNYEYAKELARLNCTSISREYFSKEEYDVELKRKVEKRSRIQVWPALLGCLILLFLMLKGCI